MIEFLGSSADGGKTLEPNSSYGISKGHIHAHIHAEHTYTHTHTPQHPRLHSVKHKELHCYCTRLKKLMNAWCYLDHRLSDCIFMANFTYKRSISRQSLQHLKSKHCDWKLVYTLIVRLRNRYFCAISHANDKYFTAMKLASQSSSILSK